MQEDIIKYCKKCVLHDRYPNIVIEENGLCNICNQKEVKLFTTLFRMAMKNCIGFENEMQKSKGKKDKYDCMLMLSGGKDSIYILNRLVTKDNLRPLVFTFNHPFESKDAQKNIENIIEKLSVEHINFTPSLTTYKNIMRNIFIRNTEGITSVGNKIKLPCAICGCYMQVCALLFAYKMNIPYILYCADPVQMLNFSSSVKEVINIFIELCGKEIVDKLPEKSQIYELLEVEDSILPKIIFPYATMNNYNADRIIAELKSLGLFESSPRETHCSLHSLLNYYSIKRYNTYYYSEEIATDVRSGVIDRKNTLEFLKKYNNMILSLAKKESLTDSDRKYVKEILRWLYPEPEKEQQLEHEVNDIENMTRMAMLLDLNIDEI